MFGGLDSKRLGRNPLIRLAQTLYVGYTGDQGGHEPLQVNGGGFFNGGLRSTTLNATGTAAIGGALTVTGIGTIGGILSIGGGCYRGYGAKNGASGGTYNLFALANPANSITGVRVKLLITNTDIQANYAQQMQEDDLIIGDSAGTDVSSRNSVVSRVQSINNTTLAVTVALTVFRSAGLEYYAVIPTVAGAAGASQVKMMYEIMAWGDQAASLQML